MAEYGGVYFCCDEYGYGYGVLRLKGRFLPFDFLFKLFLAHILYQPRLNIATRTPAQRTPAQSLAVRRGLDARILQT